MKSKTQIAQHKRNEVLKRLGVESEYSGLVSPSEPPDFWGLFSQVWAAIDALEKRTRPS